MSDVDWLGAIETCIPTRCIPIQVPSEKIISKSICFEKKYRDCFTLNKFLHRFVKILIHHTSGKNTYPLPSFFLRNTSNTLRVRRLMDYSFYNHLSRCLVKHAWYNVKFHIFSKNASTGVTSVVQLVYIRIQKKLPAATWAPTKTIRNQPCNEKTLVV